MGKYWNTSIVIKTHGISPNLSRSYYWWPIVMMKFQLFSSDLCKVVWGHQRPSAAFLSTVLDRMKIETWNKHQCVCVAHTRRIISDMTYFGHVVTLTWGQIFKLTFWGHAIYHLNRLNPRPDRGVDTTPLRFFLGGRKTAARSAAKFSIAYGASFAHLLMKKIWSDHVRSRSYDVIRGTASDRFFGNLR